MDKAPCIVAMAPFEDGWKNVELIKDCGLIPYLLYKNHGCRVTMVGAKSDEYDYLDTYVKGIRMEFLPSGVEKEKLRYIHENARQIDCLVLRGCYPTNFNVANLYKCLNPKGKIYVGLDANSHWMDRIDWCMPEFMRFMEDCDIIATSCKAMQRHLNEKWPWEINYIPNGYYDFTNQDFSVETVEKKNVILTVGRLGTKQKATDILMEAFSLISEQIPDWTLRLVGSIKPEFEDYLDDFFANFPKMKEKIQLTGSINNREEVIREYREAKIFALASTVEGGTPNVISEALNNGCAIAITKIDAYEEAIDRGKCGRACEIGSVKDLSRILLTLCTNESISDLCNHAYEYGHACFDMEKIVRKLNAMIFKGKNR